MKTQQLTRLMVPLALLAVGGFSTSVALKAADSQDSEQVSKLLSQAKTQAYQLREDASALESYSRWNSDWANHKTAINEMKDHVNAVAGTLAKLDDARATAAPWQATAIDRIKPLLREIAANTGEVIDAVNKSPKRLATKEYRDYIEANSDDANQLAELIANFVNYGNAKNRMERLAAKLELPRT